MPVKTTPFDPAEYLTDPAAQAELLNDAFESGDAGYIANALGTIARAKGMTAVARGAGVTREALYKALTPTGDPKLTTFMNVLRTLKIDLAVRPAKTGSRAVRRPGKASPAKLPMPGRSKKAARAGNATAR
jgi:probable addiction module antidote protein